MNAFEQARSLAEELSLPSTHIVRADEGRVSRIGGVPLVPADFVWPNWKDERLAFLAQVDISEIDPSIVPACGETWECCTSGFANRMQ